MTRLFVAALLFGLSVTCIFAEDEEPQGVGFEYLKMMKCPGGKTPKLGPDGLHPLQCIPGGAGPPICGSDHACWYNGFNYLCCPMGVESVHETAWRVKPAKNIKHDEVPVDSIDVPADAPAVGEEEELTSAEIVLLSKSKSATLKPRSRTFPDVTLVTEEQSLSNSTVAPANETVDQRKAPRISEHAFEEIPSSPQSIDYVDPNSGRQVEDSSSQKWQDVCPPTSSPVLIGKEAQLLACLPRDNTCPVGSFCWFSTEEDYICCNEVGQSRVELPVSESSPQSNSTNYISSTERNATESSGRPQLHAAKIVPVSRTSAEYDVGSEQNAEQQQIPGETVSDGYGREKSAIWFKPQPQVNRVAQASQESDAFSAAPARLNETDSAENVSVPTKKPKSSRRRTEGRQLVTKEEAELASSHNPKSGLSKAPQPPAPIGEEQATIPQYPVDTSKVSNLPNPVTRRPKFQQPQTRYVPNAAGGYSVVISPPQTEGDPNETAKEAAMEFYLSQIRNGWPYADEFYVPAQLNVQPGQAPVQRDAIPINILPMYEPQVQQPSQQAQLNPDVQYNYEYARWQNRNSRVRWYTKK